MRARPKERFSATYKLDPTEAATFARTSGDDNPLHSDADFAATTRFGRPIASGTQTTALLLGLTASHFSKRGVMVGLEFSVQFRRAIHADDTIEVEWMVVKVTPSPKLQGDVVDLRGRIRRLDGATAVGAKGKVLVTDSL